MRDSQLFAQRAAECRTQADAADLANVRERCLRAEAAWTAMADRSLRTENSRDAREAAAESARVAAQDCARPDFVTLTANAVEPDLIAIVQQD